MNDKFLHIKVVFEDNHLIAVCKPAGILVHSDETGDYTLADWVKSYIKKRYNKPGDVFLGVIHRIDRPVSGVVLFARTSKALIRMNEMMKERKIEKTYYALVYPRPEEFEGKLIHYISKSEDKNKVKAFASPKKDAKEAILTYALKGELDGKVWLEVRPLTGRPHQIRAQLSKIGCPIIGDLKYGAGYPLTDQSIALHCASMTFIHPVKQEKIAIHCNPPGKFPWNTFDYPENY